MKKLKIITTKDKNYPEKLLKLKNPPKQLYVLGNEALLKKQAISIVGSRDCTRYGYNQAKKFARELSRNNICIISGMAIGIDSAAHIGAKDEYGKTIAILGGGFNHIFPEENKELFYKILEKGGCIISEYEPDIEACSTHFPVRNRIISGLSDGVLVVEAKSKSGSGITARLAKKQNKTVYCLPSNVDRKTGIGTAKLIQKGAKLVLTPQDILNDFEIKEIKTDKDLEKRVNINKKYREIYKVLKNIPMNVNEISRQTGKSIIEVTTAITILELKGLVKQVNISEFIKSERD